MRLATCKYDGNVSIAVIYDDCAMLLTRKYTDMVDIIAGGRSVLDDISHAIASDDCKKVALHEISLLAPIQRFSRDIMCTGWNYLDHFYESKGRREGQDVPLPDAPTFFTKSPYAVIGPYDDIAYDANISTKWDYEAEVVIIFGKKGRSICAQDALDYVWGYCLANDVSQRNIQRRHGAQWFKGKSMDQSMPLGPWLVTTDEVDPGAIQLQCFLNGKKMQDASTGQMAFSIPELVAELTYGMTIYPGDILLTGTPTGIGNARTPQVFLKHDDELIVKGTGLGELCNKLVTTDLLGSSSVKLS